MIKVEVPAELASALLAERAAIGVQSRSGTVATLVVDGLAAATTTISLLQGPDTFLRLAALIRFRFARREGVRVRITGMRGTLDFQVGPDTDLEAVARLVRDGLVGDPK